MWLINVATRALEEFVGAADRIPRYAALSHTWDEGEEVSFQEYRQSSTGSVKKGFLKIEMACQQAARDELQYVWVDTCCIDKSSSAELSEAINSMFHWYKRSTQCYVYLQDLSIIPSSEINKGDFSHCLWFTRGWTLQELIAPSEVKFYNRFWELCFTKSSACTQLSTITGVDIGVLNHEKALNTLSVAQKMSWAASRKTTRVEDIAYCLLGIFDINMPLLYGEEDRAFFRLQEEIIRTSPDPSIFGWVLTPAGAALDDTSDILSGVLAPSPNNFSGCGKMDRLPSRLLPEFFTTNRGIKLRANFGQAQLPGSGDGYILPVCRLNGELAAIQTRNIGGGCFVRQDPKALVKAASTDLFQRLMLDPYLLTELPNPSEPQRVKDIRLARGRCIQIVLPPSMQIYLRWPWQQWDVVDNVFFTWGDFESDWSALKIVAQPSLIFLFYAFNLTKSLSSQPYCTVYRVYGGLHDRYLEDMNDRAVKEDWNPFWVSNRLKMSGIPETTSIEGDPSAGYTPQLRFRLDPAHDQNICAHAFWRVTFNMHLVSSDRASTR